MLGFKILLLFAVYATTTANSEIGVTNKFIYETTVSVEEECGTDVGAQIVGHRLKAKIHLAAIWQNPKNPLQKLFNIQVAEPTLLVPKKSNFEIRSSKLDKITSPPSYFLWESGRVLQWWDDESESQILRNLKKSVAALLQLRDEDQTVKEDDVAGNCDVIYKVRGNSIRKKKMNCINQLHSKTETQPFGVRSLTVQHYSKTDCDLKNAGSYVVDKCTSSDFIKMFSNIWQRPTVCIRAKSELSSHDIGKEKHIFSDENLDSVLQEIKKSFPGTLKEGHIFADSEIKEQSSSNNLIDSLTKYQDSLKEKNLAKTKSASAFYKLLPIFQNAQREDIKRVLQNDKLKVIMPQILGLIAASCTRNAVTAALEHFISSKSSDELLERFLISLSVLPRPDGSILEELMSFIEKRKHSEKVQATLISTLGSILRTYAQHYEIADKKIVDDARVFLERGLQECSSDSCSSTYLRGLRNAAQPKSSSLLLKYALKGGKPALEAVFALRNIPGRLLPPESQKTLLKVFHQVGLKQDRSVRAIAAEILLHQQPDESVLKSILGSLSDQTDAEFSTFLAMKILHILSKNEELRSQVMKILNEREISHYYSLAQKGSSSLFTRPLLSADGVNVTYGIEMEMLNGGLLKRSSFDVDFETSVGISNLLSVGMFAEGLSSLAGDSSGEEGVDPTAGMELTFLESSLRPYVFFSGTSELMGHAWSGTASEPTPALQGIFALSDDKNFLVLNNGMIARLELRGVLSVDLSASIQISLWNRNSQSQVKNAAALLMVGVATVGSDIATTQGAFNFMGQSAIEFKTDLEFYESPFKMCLQMDHPDVIIKRNFQRSVEITGSKFLVKKSKKRKRLIPRRSYALHQSNNEQCRDMNIA